MYKIVKKKNNVLHFKCIVVIICDQSWNEKNK